MQPPTAVRVFTPPSQENCHSRIYEDECNSIILVFLHILHACYIFKCSVRFSSVPNYIVLETHTSSTEAKERSPKNNYFYSFPSIVHSDIFLKS